MSADENTNLMHQSNEMGEGVMGDRGRVRAPLRAGIIKHPAKKQC